MGTTYTSTIEVRCWKEHTCICCGAIYAYQFVRKVNGQGGTAEKASINARAAAQKSMERDVDLRPCPSCGLYQPDMIGQQRARRHWTVFWLGLIACAAILILELSHVIQASTAIWASVALCGAAALFQWRTDLRNLNRDTASNQAVANGCISSGTMMLGQAGQALPGAQELSIPRRSAFHQLLLAMTLAAVVLAASPELVRITQGWALNGECYPPVIGPGDQTRIYMNQKIGSIKSYWRGRPQVIVYEAGKEQTAQKAGASTNQNDWGSTIYAKSSEKNSSSTPWVLVSMPADPNLAGKTVTCEIDLQVEFPESKGAKAFQTRSMNMRRSVTMQLASAGAGERYTGWWWQGTVAGMGLVLLCALFLVGTARSLQRRAKPTRVFVLNDPGNEAMKQGA